MSKTTSVTVDLEYPVEHDGRTIDRLTMRRMKAKDALIAEAETSEACAGYALFAALAGVDRAVIEELDLADMETLSKAAAPLMGKQPPAPGGVPAEDQADASGAT